MRKAHLLQRDIFSHGEKLNFALQKTTCKLLILLISVLCLI